MIADRLGVTVYEREIEEIVRMPRRDENDTRPGPVLATFDRVVLRDAIITKKVALHSMVGMDKVYINADEPLHVRRAKAILRKAAYLAKTNGDEVEARHDRIMINNKLYTIETTHTLPTRYLSTTRDSARQQASAEKGDQETDMAVGPNPNDENEGNKFTILPGENMRLTKKGLCFSGPSAFPSNLARYPIKYKNRPYISNEQAYQWTKATTHDENDIAVNIETSTEAWDIMYAGSDISTTEEWNDSAPDLLAELVIIKYEQHPELLERLISTYPHRLIEASVSKRWGGGAPISSDIYESDKPLPGKNVFGDIETNYRNTIIEQRRMHKQQCKTN